VTNIAATPFCRRFLLEISSVAIFGKKNVKITPNMNTKSVVVEDIAETRTTGTNNDAKRTPKPPQRFTSSLIPFIANIAFVLVFKSPMNCLKYLGIARIAIPKNASPT
jgi:hypothetical protein